MARKSKTKSPKGKTRTTSLSFRDGDTIVETTVTTKTVSAVVDYDEIFDACEVVVDEMNQDAPWDNCDGYTHTATPVSDLDGGKRDGADAAQGYAYDRSNRERVLIELDAKDDWGIVKYARAGGASKQVAQELLAMARRRTLKQLVNWYENGWEYWGVKCDFLDENESVWGIDDYQYADKYVRAEIASQVVYALEKKGFTVINKPEDEHKLTLRRMTDAVSAEKGVHRDIYPRSMTAADWKAEWKRNLNSQNAVDTLD